jgi:hypothetical protein
MHRLIVKWLGRLCASLMLIGAGALPATAATGPETQIQYLSGTGKDDAVLWDFFCTGGRNSGVWTKIHVPSCWEQEGFGVYNYGYKFRGKGATVNNPDFATEQGKYKMDFTVPAAWKGQDINLVFDGVMTDTEALVNGQSVGPVHQGSFYRFKYDITALVKFGEPNHLEVNVSKESANASVNNAERRGDYWNFGGIFRPVYLEARPAQHIDWTALDARADGSFKAEVHLGAGVTAPAQVSGQILDAQGQPVGAPFTADLAAGADNVTLQSQLSGVKLWSAETPNLYTVRLTLSEGGVPVHTITQRFGFRTFEVRAGDGLYLNGQKITLKGVDRHSFWPESGRTLSKQICIDDVKLIKEANMNAVRMSHYPPDVDFLEACDELGLYVLDELAGWHASYDTPTGTRLIGEMVRRDVNHPSILFWDNGNEGGWNKAVDGEFAKWDPQQRHVLHPWELHGDVQTKHYPTYTQVQQYTTGKDIFMPTEFLHGLYDGGGGSGFDDYWALMGQSPITAGGFFWAFLDEGVARTDENGRIDNQDNLAPDGIVGPHREKEGSFFTIRQIWSPVQVGPATLPVDFNGTFTVANHFDFTNLSQCQFTWALVQFPGPYSNQAGHTVIAGGNLSGPDVAPHGSGELKVPLPDSWRQADALYVTAKDPMGRELWTWTWPLTAQATVTDATMEGKVQSREENGQWVVSVGTTEWRFDKTTGMLAGVRRGSQTLSLSNGPRFFAYSRAAKSGNQRAGTGPGTRYDDVSGNSTLTGITAKPSGNNVVVEADFSGPLQSARWTISPDGSARLDYSYTFNGTVDILGVNFDYPEANVKSKRWLGEGPYHVWQNRLKGTQLDVWQNAYNDPVPADTYAYPEFKGFFRDWQWVVFDTTEGALTIRNDGGTPFLGVFTPKDGRVGPVLALPQFGLSFLQVIPAMGSKFQTPDALGPESAPHLVSGVQQGSVQFSFTAP